MILLFYAKNQREFKQLGNKRQRIMHFPWDKYQKGFSLIEMMVAVVILGLIILALVTFFTGGTKAWVAGQSQLEAQRNARLVMDRMVREIREASEITGDSTTTKIIFNTPWKTGVTYEFELTSNTIKRNSNPLINNVSNLDFDYTFLSKVHIILEVDVDKDGNPDISLNADVNLRNYGGL